MRGTFPILMGVLGVGISLARSQTLLNSWENSPEGWTIANPAIWTDSGFSTTTGVTAGVYSWKLTATNAPDFGMALYGPYSTNLTALLARAASVQMDVYAPNGHFAWGVMFDLVLSQPAGAGTMDVSGFSGLAMPGAETTLVFTIPQSVRTALLDHSTAPTALAWGIGGGGAGTMYLDNLQVNPLPALPARLWVRELWDDLDHDVQPALTRVTDDSSSVGFDPASPWVVNPAETNNCRLMAFSSFGNEPLAGASSMGLPGTLDGSHGCMVQQNSGFAFFPGAGEPTFWSDGIFMTRALVPENYLNFQAAGEYWFSMTIGNSANSSLAQYVTFPASGWGGFGFADGETTNAHFVAIGVTGPNVYIGPTNAAFPWGQTNVSKALYISQGTLGQTGNPNSTLYNPFSDPNADPPEPAPPYNEFYSQTNFTGGPYHINAFGDQTVGHVNGDCLVVLGRLRTHGDGTATVDAKYYGVVAGTNPWNTELDTNTDNITWDCSYTFGYGGTMTGLLLFENGQFPFYVFGVRASRNFQDVVGLDPGRMAVAPTTNPYTGFPILMTNLAVEANSWSWEIPPAGYGTLNYQWYRNGTILVGATDQYLNIANAASTNVGTYTCTATDPSGTWNPVTNSVTVFGPIPPLPPNPPRVQMFGQNCLQVTFYETDLTGVDNANHYVFSGGIVATNVTVFNTADTTVAQLLTTTLPPGTKFTLTISGLTNVLGPGVTLDLTFWTDLIQSGTVNWEGWLYPAEEGIHDYFYDFVPTHPHPGILQSMELSSWDGPTTDIFIIGSDGYLGDGFGGRLYGWFIPPITTNYVFFCCADDSARLSLSTNSAATNLFVIACESLWSGANQWTNIGNQYPSGPHRGDGTTNSWLQNRSDQFIAAYEDDLNGIWTNAVSHVTNVVVPGTPFWPSRDANGQALIALQAGQKYFLQLEHMQIGGGYDESVTYKIAGGPDPFSGNPGGNLPVSGASSLLTGTNIAGFVPFQPTLSFAETPGGPQISYTGVLLSGTTPLDVYTPVAISSNGVCIYSPAATNSAMFYRTEE